MKMLQYLFIFSCFFALSSIMTVDAQQTCTDPATGGQIACPPTAAPEQPSSPDIPDADGDGTPDVRDECPDQGGPDWNQGCPVPADADGDGTPDTEDDCPNQGGPDWNNGCPTDQTSTTTTQDLPTLPQFEFEDGYCWVATRTTTPVNLREEPNINSPVLYILDPYIPVLGLRTVIIRGGLVEEWWWIFGEAFAHDAAVRVSPGCDDKRIWYINDTRERMSMVVEGLEVSGYNQETIQEQTAVILICPGYSTVLLPTDALTDCSGNGVSSAPNGERFLCDDTWVEAYEDCTFPSFPSVLISESAQMMTLTIAPPLVPAEAAASDAPPSDEERITLVFGNTNSMDELMFSPDFDHPPDPGEEGMFVALLLGDVPDINLVGFNPQPEPPAPASNFGLLIGLNVPGDDANSQPEPPAIVTNFGQFSLNPTANGYQLINAEGVGVEISPVDLNLISVDDLTLWPFPDMPDMTMWTVEGEDGEITTIMCPGSDVSFNPQPEPPAPAACFSVTPIG